MTKPLHGDQWQISLLECIMCGSCHTGEPPPRSAVFFKVLPLLPHIFFCPLPAPCSEAASEYEKVLFRREESVAVAKIMEDVFLAC